MSTPTPTIQTTKCSLFQQFKKTEKTSTADTVSIPVGSYWSDTTRLNVNVFLLLKYPLGLAQIKPEFEWDNGTKKLNLDFKLVYDPNSIPSDAENVWYLEYIITFDSAVDGDLTLKTILSETLKGTTSLPETKRGTTTNVQH